MTELPRFGSELRRYRRDAGLTQEELAERAGLSTRTVSDLERGLNSRPQAATLEMLVGALELSPEDRSKLVAAVPQRRHPSQHASRSLSLLPLPAEVTPLIGRESDEAAAIHLLQSQRVRLLTLIGPGGVGKTRLALRVAETLSGEYVAGVCYVPLAALTSPEILVRAISRASGLRDSGGDPPIETLSDWLRDHQVLLVLDNFEHLARAATIVSDLLTGCPLLTVLATSRVPLRLRGEQLLEVPSLRAPPSGDDPTAEVAIGYSAIALFVQRTRAVRPEFELTDDQVSVVADICHRLDNLPLAIELAAAQARHMSAETLLNRLKRGIRGSSLGPVDVPPRQQTMWETIAWSYDLLEDDERRFFRALSVFAGGCSLEAAEYVVDPACTPNGPDVLTALDGLVEKSLLLLRTEDQGEPRYSMLETVREHGRKRAEAAGESGKLHKRHADFFVEVALEADATLREQGLSKMSARLLPDHENFQAALRWLHGGDRLEQALDLAGALVEYWIPWGFVREGREWIDSLLDQAGRDSIDAPLSAIKGSARLAWIQTDYDRARAQYEKAVVACRQLGDAQGEAYAVNNLGAVAHMRNDYDRAAGYYERAIELGRLDDNSPRTIGMSVSNLGLIALHRGEYDRAEELLSEGVALWRGLGDDHLLAVTLGNLGSLAFRQGRYDDAVTIQEEALAMKRKAGDRLAVAKSLGDIALAETERGNNGRAQDLLGDALKVFDETGQRDAVAEALEAMAGIARRDGEYDRAARLYGGAAAIREDIGAAHRSVDRMPYEAAVGQLRELMLPAAFDRAWSVGQHLGWDDLIRDALFRQAVSESSL